MVDRIGTWLRGFSRVTSSGRFIAEVDGLRFVAIAMVVVYHLNIYALTSYSDDISNTFALQHLVRLGHYGVEVFFVLSGFILALPFAYQSASNREREFKFRKYLLRRLTRLEPPYLLILGMLLVFRLVVEKEVDYGETLSSAAASALYLHDIIYGTYSPLLGVAWSLEIEVQFYLLMPLFSYLLWKPIQLRFGLYLLVVVVFSLLEPRALLPVRSLMDYIQYFFAGILVADVYANRWHLKISPWFATWGVFLAGIAFIIFSWDHGTKSHLDYLSTIDRVLPLLLATGFVCAFRSSLFKRVLRTPVLVIIGGMCYSIYLTHFAAISLTGKLVGRYFESISLESFICLAVIAVLVVGAVYFRLVERPFMATTDLPWLKRILRLRDSTDAGS